MHTDALLCTVFLHYEGSYIDIHSVPNLPITHNVTLFMQNRLHTFFLNQNLT